MQREMTSVCDPSNADSMSLLQRVESGMASPDWHAAMRSLQWQRVHTVELLPWPRFWLERRSGNLLLTARSSSCQDRNV